MATPTPITTARFWSKAKVRSATQCWPWTAQRNAKGYGHFQNMKAHRVAYEMVVGPIPSGMMVLHKCDNPPCVNPAHLFLGDHDDNMADMVSKGRGNAPRGEDHPNCKLSDDDVVAIRASEDRGVDLARHYGVAASTISEVRSYRWRV